MEHLALVILPALASIIAYFIMNKVNDIDKNIDGLKKKVDYQSKRITEHVDKIRDDHHEVRNKMIDVQRDQNREMARMKGEQILLRNEMAKHSKLFNTVFKVMDKHEKFWRSKKD